MEKDFAALNIAEQTSVPTAASCAQSERMGSQSTPASNAQTGVQVRVFEIECSGAVQCSVLAFP